MFSGIVNGWKKGDAVSMLSTALKRVIQTYPHLQGIKKTTGLATEIIDIGWEANESLFSGRRRPRPHRISIAFWSVSYALENTKPYSEINQLMVFTFAMFAQDIAMHRHNYNFNEIDELILDDAYSRGERVRSDANQAKSNPIATDG